MKYPTSIIISAALCCLSAHASAQDTSVQNASAPNSDPLSSIVQHTSSLAQAQLTQVEQTVELQVKNPNKTAVQDAPVCIALPPHTLYQSATVCVDGKEVPSQMDDLDGDGFKDELAFVMDMKRKGKKLVKVTFALHPDAADRYTARTHAMLFFRDKEHGNHIPTDTVSEVKDDMYSKVFPHGPAFESELIGLRVYFNAKQSADLYGKKVKQLEFQDGMWYSFQKPELKARNFGDDIIFLGETVSVGGLRGWNDADEKTPLVNITPFDWRQAHVVAKGPVRAIVDMNVRGWQYQGQKLDVKSRYILYAGHRDCEITQQFNAAAQGLEFATGTLKVGTVTNDPEEVAKARTQVDPAGTCASYGSDWPDKNRKLFPNKEAVGVAVTVPQAYVTRYVDRPDQMLFGIKPGTDNAIHYKMMFCAPMKETFEQWTADSWFKYVDQWKQVKPVEVKVKK